MTRIATLCGRLRRGSLLAGLSLLVLSCGGGDGTGPNPHGGKAPIPAAIGDTLSDQWSNAGDSVRYRVKAATATTLAVYGEAHTAGFVLAIKDSATGASLASVPVFASGSSNLFAIRTPNVNLAAGQVVFIRVIPGNSSGSFRLFLAEVNLAPETGSSVVAVGDTIQNILEHPADVDRFFVHAATPLEFAVFGRSLKDGIAFALGDSADESALGYSFSDEDAAASHLVLHRTGVVVIPAGHTAEVRVQRLPGGFEAGGYVLWLYPVNRTPEHVPAAMVVNDTISGEVLENSADIDEFTVTVPTPTELIGYLGGTPQLFPQSAWLFVSGAGVSGSPNIQHQPGATELEGSATGRFTAAAGSLNVEVRGVSTDLPTNYTTPAGYSVMLRHVDRLPEHVSAVLTVTDTVENEAIDYVGDVDEFTLPVQTGDLRSGFLQAVGQSGIGGVSLAVMNGIDTLGVVTSLSGDTALADHHTGTMVSPVTGSLALSIEGRNSADVVDRGGYRLFAYRINPAPEILAAQINPGDSLAGETIEFPGDVDSFTVAASASDGLNFFVIRSNTDPYSLDFNVSGLPGWTQWVPCPAPPQGPQFGCGTGRIDQAMQPRSLAVGGYTRYRAPYSVVMYPISFAVEGQGGTLAPGATVTSTLVPPGDVDTYLINYTKGQLLDIGITTGPGVVNFNFNAWAGLDPLSNPFMAQSTSFPHTFRFEFPQSGTYSVRVFGASNGVFLQEQGSYTLTLDTIPLTPEVAPAGVVPGDSVATESIDFLGDVDEFILSAPAGSEIQARNVPRNAGVQFNPSAWVIGDSLPLRQGTFGVLGRTTMPANGQLRIRMAEPRGVFPAYSVTGMYGIAFYQINRAPEHVAAAILLGTPVTGEDLSLEGDVDEFTFQGTMGQVVTGTISSPQAFSPGVIVFEILDPTGTTVLGSTTAHDATLGSTGLITLPANGTYIVRVAGSDDTQGTGGYQFTVQ